MRAILFTGGIYHDFDAMTAATAGILASADFAVETVRSPEELVAALNRRDADLVVVQALRWRMLGNAKYEPFRAEWAYTTEPELIAALEAHAARAGVVSLHTGCICFDDWDGWHAILGGGWVWGKSWHAPDLETVRVSPATGSAVTEGVAAFAVTDEHYRDLDIRHGTSVLADGVGSSGVSHPVAWSRDGGVFAGRAVTLTVGHDLASLLVPGQARFIRQAALWAAAATERTRP